MTRIPCRWPRAGRSLWLQLALALAVTLSVQAEDLAPVLTNPNFECVEGVDVQEGIPGATPAGWTAVLLEGLPVLNSARLEFTGVCEADGFVEHIDGLDSLVFLAEDIETPPEPGKPFDAVVYQQVEVVPGQSYSLSGWMVSLCGGSFSAPNDCPADYFIAKSLGADPTGGLEPQAETVIWSEDRRNFTESGWVNLHLAALPEGDALTVFVRARSPYRWHGNHAFADAISIMRAPAAHFLDLPTVVTGMHTLMSWAGDLGPDIPAIPEGTHQLLFDVQHRQGPAAEWVDWVSGHPSEDATFIAPLCSGDKTFDFRVRARAEQPQGTPGAWPNHRYVGIWSAPASIHFIQTQTCDLSTFLPFID